jgi:hypothetical protein
MNPTSKKVGVQIIAGNHRLGKKAGELPVPRLTPKSYVRMVTDTTPRENTGHGNVAGIGEQGNQSLRMCSAFLVVSMLVPFCLSYTLAIP